MLRNAVNEEMTDDFEAGDGDDVGEASSHELPSRDRLLHRRRAPSPRAGAGEPGRKPVREPQLDERNVAKLRTALDELLECRRMLDAAMKAS